METELPILEQIRNPEPKLPTHEPPPTNPPTERSAEQPSRKASQPTTKAPKLQSTQPPTKMINDAAKTLNIFRHFHQFQNEIIQANQSDEHIL